MAKHSLALALFVGLAWARAMTRRAEATPPDVTFLCDKMPQVCSNMCWAVRCASPRFSQTLTWDNADEATQALRRASEGCQRGGGGGGDDRCADAGQDLSCNAYPLATTKDSTFPNGHQVSRCVPRTEQVLQAQVLQAAFDHWKSQNLTSRTFTISFGNPGAEGVRYCGNQACTNDGFELQDARVTKRSPALSFAFDQTASVAGSMDREEALAAGDEGSRDSNATF